MNKANMRKWVAALRSGDYLQTQGALHKDDGYCCLGVVCEISKLGEWVRAEFHEVVEDPHYTYQIGYEAEHTHLPEPVREWLGVNSPNPLIKGNLHSIAANDSQGLSFNEIADLLEDYYDLKED
jgi:hypothetical protein